MSKPSDTPDKHAADESKTDGEDGFSLSRDEKKEVERKRPPRAAVLHEIIRSDGEQELKRTVAALGWSSLAAGLSMGFSLLARGVLHRYVGDTPGGFLIESLGYPLGFLLVILSRQQLFTENIMTAVLPVMTEPTLQNFRCFLRLWSVVLVGNLVGVSAFAFGLLLWFGPLLILLGGAGVVLVAIRKRKREGIAATTVGDSVDNGEDW